MSMIDEVIESIKGNEDKQDAERWRKLIRLVGDDSATVRLYRTILTKRPIIEKDLEQYEGEPNETFSNLIDSILEPIA